MKWTTIEAPSHSETAIATHDKGGGWQWGADGGPDERAQRQREKLERGRYKEIAEIAGGIAAAKAQDLASEGSRQIVRSAWEATRENVSLSLLTAGVIILHGSVTWLRPIINTAISGIQIATNPLGMLMNHAPGSLDNTPLKEGDKVGGFVVTSGFGPREAPAPGASTNHPGIDLNTPIGTPLYAPGAIAVTCHNQPSGYGIYAKWTGDNPGMAGHLSSCTEGQFQYGQQFAITGDTGIGTAAHLDVREGASPNFINPTRGFVEALLGIAPAPSQRDSRTVLVSAEIGSELDSEQVRVASEIIAAAQSIGARSERELTAVLMAALQESSLREDACCDHDSVGVLQQRIKYWPSASGGISGQVEGFFQGSGTNPGFWDLDNGGELGSVIQAVQKSAHPGKYSKWESLARELVRSAQLQPPSVPRRTRTIDLLNRGVQI